MQTVDWPRGIPSLAAHEGFRYIAQKLYQDSRKLEFAFNAMAVKL